MRNKHVNDIASNSNITKPYNYIDMKKFNASRLRIYLDVENWCSVSKKRIIQINELTKFAWIGKSTKCMMYFGQLE